MTSSLIEHLSTEDEGTMEKSLPMEGVSPTTVEKLRSAGYTSYDEIMKMSPSGLSSELGISLRSAEIAVAAARSRRGGPPGDGPAGPAIPCVVVRSETQPRMSRRLRDGLRRFSEGVRGR